MSPAAQKAQHQDQDVHVGTTEARKLAAYLCAGQQDTDLLCAMKPRNTLNQTTAHCRLQVSLPTKILRLQGESTEQQFSRIPTSEQAGGIMAACKDYMQLQKKRKLTKWAEKILDMGAAGTTARAAALVRRHTEVPESERARSEAERAEVEAAAAAKEVDAERRLKLMNAIGDLLHDYRDAGEGARKDAFFC